MTFLEMCQLVEMQWGIYDPDTDTFIDDKTQGDQFKQEEILELKT